MAVPGSRFPGCCRSGARPTTSAARSCWDAWSRPAGRRRPGSCQAVLLCGEPGIGKTRTAAEVAQAAFDEGAVALYGRCDEEIGVPYQPFAEALDWYTGHVGQPVLGRHPAELIRLQPLLRSRLAGLAAPVSSDPRSQEYLLFEAARSWLVELSRQQPVVLVLDDLHWAPRPVLLLLRHVLRAAVAEGDGVRLLVLGTYRDTELDRSHALAGVMADVRRLPGVEQLRHGRSVGGRGGRVAVPGRRAMSSTTTAGAWPSAFMPRPKAIRSSWARCSAIWSRPGWCAAKTTAGWSPAVTRWRCPKGSATWSGGVWDGCRRRPARCCRWRPCSAATSTSSCWPRCVMPPRAACLTPWTRRWGRDLSEETGADRYRFAHVLVRATLLGGAFGNAPAASPLAGGRSDREAPT